jgi:hypothetical protein
VEARMQSGLWECHLPLCNDCSKAVLIAAWGLLRLEPTGRYTAILGDPSTIPPPVEPDIIPQGGYITIRPPGACEPILKEYLDLAAESLGGDESTPAFGITIG